MRQVLVSWGIGFAYTGFSLIENSFVELFKDVLEASTEAIEAKQRIIRYL